MSSERIRVLVVDDHAIVREGIRHVLAETPGFEVVGEAGDGAQAMVLAREHRPDVVVLDITMPGESGIDVAQRLRRAVPDTKVLILSMHDQSEYVLEAVRAGAHGYVLKDAGPGELRGAVRAVHGGGEFFSPAVAGKLSAAVRAEAEQEHRQSLLGLLTVRECDVLVGVASGRTSREIGADLGISPRTVETHRESIVRKTRIRTVAGLTKFAIEMGLLSD